MHSIRICCFTLAPLLIACYPAVAQPTADAQSVTITYTGSAGANTASVNISNATNVSARISPNLGANGSLVNSSDPATAVFTQNVVGNTINIGTNSGPLGTLARSGATSYSGAVLRVSATGCIDCISIPLTLAITGGAQLTVQYNGAAIPSSGVQVFASTGGSTTFQLTLTSPLPSGFSISTNVPWLSATPQAGNLQGATPQTVTFTAIGSNLSGANNAVITINSNNAVAATVPVVFNVGSGGGLTLSPNPLTFQYSTSSNSFVTPQTQSVSVSGPPTSAVYTAQSNQSWLQVFGVQSVVDKPITTPMPVSVNVANVLPATGTFTGTVTVQSAGFASTLTVNLTIGTVTGGTSNLTFSVATPGGSAPAAQQFQISGSGIFSASAIENTGTNVTWLLVSPTSGQLSSTPTTLTVSVFPGNLPAGTYTGSIFISTFNGLLQNGTNSMTVGVTLNIGGSGMSGAVVSPTALVFNLPPGGTQTQSFIVNGDGTSFNIQSFAPGVNVSPTSGPTPSIVTVTANTSSPTSGSLIVTSSLGSQTVNLTVNVPGGNVLTSTPSSLSYINPAGTPQTTNLSINASGDNNGNHLTFVVTSVPSFVSYSANSTTTPTVIGISINPSALGPGFNTGNLVLTANSAANNTLVIPIAVLTPGATPGFTATPSTVSLAAQAFGAPVTSTVQLSGLSGTNFSVSTSSSGNWLSASPISGTSPATLTLMASPQSLGVNTYAGTVTVTGNNGVTLTIPVTLTTSVNAPSTPALSVATNTVTFNYKKGDPAPAAVPVAVSGGGSAVSFTATTTANWITVTPASGTTPATLNVSLNTAALADGPNTGTITVTAPGVTGSPQTINVTANVTSPAVLSLSSGTANFSFRTGAANPAAQTVQVSSTGAALPFTVSVSNAPWLTVTPASGTTPAALTLNVNPSGLSVGQYTANVSVNSSGGNSTIAVVLAVSAPLPTIAEVHNGASNQSGPIAPGLIVVITGTSLGPEPLATYVLTGNRFSTTVANTRVLIGGLESPIIYTSSTQVAAVVPYAMAGRASTIVQVEYLGQRSNAVTVQVASTAPGVFTANSSGTGPGAILNQDNSLNSAANPAGVNTTIQVFATGEGQTIPAGGDGRLADNPSALPKPILPVTATINGVPAAVTYYGAAPGLIAGLLQVNIMVPPGAGSGDVVLTIGGNRSQPGVTVAIR